MKNIIKSVLAVAVLGLAVTSCKKGDITSKRLDGTWKLSSGTTKRVSTNTNASGVATTTTSDNVYDGTTRKVTTTQGSAAAVVSTTPYTEEYTFDKSNDTYTLKTTYTSTYTYTGYYYTTATCDWNSAGDYDVTETTTTNQTTSGSFTILGSTGDIEKNSRLMLEFTKSDETETTKYTYKNNGADVTVQLYTSSGSSCKAADVTKTVTSSSTSSLGSTPMIWTVKAMDSSEMTVDVADSYTDNSASGGSNTSTTTGEIVYKQD